MYLENFARLGRVTAVNQDKFLSQVWFPDLEIGSDWFPVLRASSLPKINDLVLVLFLSGSPNNQPDGVILGVLTPWQ